MFKWTPEGEALTQLVLAVFRVNGALLSAGDRLAAEEGQSSARWQVLGAIDDGPRTVPGIAREMGLARQSVQRTVDLLETDGLVERRKNPAHLRSQLIAMTSKGRKTFAAIATTQVAWVNGLARDAGLTEGEISSAMTVLKKLERTAGNDQARPRR